MTFKCTKSETPVMKKISCYDCAHFYDGFTVLHCNEGGFTISDDVEDPSIKDFLKCPPEECPLRKKRGV